MKPTRGQHIFLLILITQPLPFIVSITYTSFLIKTCTFLFHVDTFLSHYSVNGGGKLWGRSLARTLLDLGPPFDNPQGPPLRPLYLDMPTSGR